MSNSHLFIKELRISAWATSSARFNAARRLKLRDLFAAFSIALFSSIGIGLAVMQKTYAVKADSAGDRYLTLLAVCIGLFVLVISLVEWAAGNTLRADSLHRNAEDLNTLQRKIQQRVAFVDDGQTLLMSDVDNLRAEYETLKAKCPYNHESIDYRYFLAVHRFSPEFLDTNKKPCINGLESFTLHVRNWWSALGFYPVFWLVIFTLVCLIPMGQSS